MGNKPKHPGEILKEGEMHSGCRISYRRDVKEAAAPET